MARPKLQAAARKLAASLETERKDEADEIGAGVRTIAKEIVGDVEPGSLYWRAPLQYIAEQIGPRLAREHKLEDVNLDELRAYLLVGFNEYVVALAGEFDPEHFKAWTAAMIAGERERAAGLSPDS
jgi:hypothetical protein